MIIWRISESVRFGNLSSALSVTPVAREVQVGKVEDVQLPALEHEPPELLRAVQARLRERWVRISRTVERKGGAKTRLQEIFQACQRKKWTRLHG